MPGMKQAKHANPQIPGGGAKRQRNERESG